MFFHTGGHPDYHKPTDDPEKVDYASLGGIVELEKAIIEASFSFETLHFRNTDPVKEEE